MPFKFITLTGADERTSVEELAQMVTEHDQLEVGLLYTASPDGRNRYPDVSWLTHAAKALTGRCAIHVCGRQARNQMLAGELEPILKHAARVQVNGVLSLDEIQELAPFASELIVQYNDSNQHLIDAACFKVSLLMDSSGGRGFSPSRWSRPTTPKKVGFAGGLGPLNLAAQLPLIADVAGENSWVDMETRLRHDDWFDVALARQCLAIWEQHRARAATLV